MVIIDGMVEKRNTRVLDIDAPDSGETSLARMPCAFSIAVPLVTPESVLDI